jgi:hypothetical protein
MEPQVPLRATALAILASAFLAPAAMADFSRTTCDNPKFEAFMLAHLGRGTQLRTNRPAKDRLLFGPIASATTISNSGSSIACEIVVSAGNRVGPRQIHGRFTATGHGWKWQPGY